MSSGTAVLDRATDRIQTPRPPQGGGDAPRPPQGARAPVVPNGMLAILAFIVFESMLFAGLLGGFSVLKVANS